MNQILSDYQDWPNGGDGYMRILTFRPADNQVDVETFSPTLNSYFTTDGQNNFSMELHNDGTPGPYTTGVKGRVYRTDCSVVAGAAVNDGTAQATTGTDGTFMLPTPVGTQAVVVNASGMQAQTQSTQVSAGYSSQIDIYMGP